MVRLIATIGLILALGACRSDAPVARASSAAAVSTQNANDTRRAKPLFGAMAAGSAQAPAPLGFYSRGCQAGAVQLPETGPTWQAMRLSRNRNWSQPVTVDFVEDLSRFAATQPGWSGLYVGDMSQPRGGPMITGHASHQSGLDVDIWLNPPARVNLSRDERENISAINYQRERGAYINSGWTPQHEAILRQAAMDPRVNRIFIFAGAKVHMCDNATGDRSWLHKIRPWYGHNDHMHVRLNCPPGAEGCEGQGGIPAGDGCDDARAWVNDILHPRPADPNAPAAAPSRELTMADLPGQCVGVLASN